jgi:hypothetical protein
MTSQKRWILAIWMIFGCAISTAAVEQARVDESMNGVYAGTIGGRQVVLELGKYEKESRQRNGVVPKVYLSYSPVAGRFFYRQDAFPFELRGDVQKDGSILLADQDSAPYPAARLRFTIAGGKATGEFCKCDLSRPEQKGEQRLPVALTRVSTGFNPDMEWEPESTNQPDQVFYDAVLDFPLRAGPEIHLNQQISYVVQTDRRFFMSMPLFTGFSNREVTQRINQNLREEFNKNRLIAFQCSWDHNGSRMGHISGKPKIRIARGFLVLEFDGMDCGGPHVTEYTNDCLAYDLKTGEKLKETETSQLPGCMAVARE